MGSADRIRNPLTSLHGTSRPAHEVPGMGFSSFQGRISRHKSTAETRSPAAQPKKSVTMFTYQYIRKLGRIVYTSPARSISSLGITPLVYVPYVCVCVQFALRVHSLFGTLYCLPAHYNFCPHTGLCRQSICCAVVPFS